MKSAQKQAGFSLLETLLGLTLTAMVAVLMTGSMQLGARVWERTGDGNTAPGRHVLDNRVGDWIAQALPTGVYDQADTEAAPFHGSPDAVSWIVAGDNLGGSPGIYRADLLLAEAHGCEGGRSLQIRMTLLSPDGDLQAVSEIAPTARILAPCLIAPAFAFYGMADIATAPGWTIDWIQQGQLPLIVQLSAGPEEASRSIIFSQRLTRATSP